MRKDLDDVESILRLLYGLDITLDELVATYNRHYRPPVEPIPR